MDREQADKLIAQAAESHRTAHAHAVAVRPGVGWACETCDSDIWEAFCDGSYD